MMHPSEHIRADRSKVARAKYFQDGVPSIEGVASRISRSWKRCSEAGQDPSRSIGFDIIKRSRVSELAERNGVLIELARGEMERLASVVARAKLIALLSDEFGTIIDIAGEIVNASDRLKLAARRGVDLSEASAGTNAVGTALIERTAVATVAYEHYFDANTALTCIGAPLFGPDGRLSGVLDVSGDHDTTRPDCLELIRTSAQAIENRLVRNMSGVALFSFSPREELLATPWEALLAFDPDGRLVGGNGRARTILAIEPGARDVQFEDLFESISFAEAVHDRGASGRLRTLRSVSGLRVMGQFEPSSSKPSAKQRRPGSSGQHPLGKDGMSKYDTAMSLFQIVAGDRRTAQAVERVQRGLQRGLPVLLAGETGSGKELVARVLHRLSARSDGPFVPVNCGALPESLIEAELFGYADGAFTGARRGGAPGKFELANGGTLFLDEIGDMPVSSQTKLLRVLQERSVTRLADSRERPIDIALISATHHNLIELIAKGLFREDLYYRINGLGTTLPPLRERSNILELAQFHLEKEGGIEGRFELSEASRDLLVRHPWPGNLRQLGHVIASATAIADRGCLIEPEHFPEEFVAQNVLRSRSHVSATAQSSLFHEAEMDIIEKTIKECGGNISATARLLKISRSTIYNKWKRD